MVFGEGPLSLLPMVEAMETLFVPVVIRNNVEGYEREVLERYGEPTWNNPVIRFVDGDGKDVLPRKDRVWKTPDVLARMLAALEAAEQEVPAWLDVYAQETLPAETERAVFAMHCFWVGQAKLGALDGVVRATPGWLDGAEVVDVEYLPERMAFSDLVGAAARVNCARRVYTTTDAQAEALRARDLDASPLAGDVGPAKPTDDLHDLARSPLRFLPLTPLQALRVNGALAAGEDGAAWLSPRQRAFAKRVAKHPGRVAELARPADVAALAAYADALEAALTKEER